ncbi:MAG TPA: hypothetical protein VIC26_16150, partial [Marinagarivorans sp.]
MITHREFSMRCQLLLFVFVYSIPIPLFGAPIIPDEVAEDVFLQRTENAFNDKWDWLQLTSGEWLKGKIKVVYNGEMEFDSSNLGLRKISLDS